MIKQKKKKDKPQSCLAAGFNFFTYPPPSQRGASRCRSSPGHSETGHPTLCSLFCCPIFIFSSFALGIDWAYSRGLIINSRQPHRFYALYFFSY